MDPPSEAADEEPAAASVSADSTLRGKKHPNQEGRRSPGVSEGPADA